MQSTINNILIKKGGNKKFSQGTQSAMASSNLLPTSMAMTYTISGEGNGLNYSILRQLLKDQENFGIYLIIILMKANMIYIYNING